MNSDNYEMDFEKTASFLFAQVTTAQKNRLEKRMNAIGLHSGQVFVLFELWKHDGQSQINLAKKLNVSAPTVNKMLKGLSDSGFVVSGRYEDDARTTRAHLTEKGVNIREEIIDQWRKLEQETLANLTRTEKLILLDILEKLRNSYFEKSG